MIADSVVECHYDPNIEYPLMAKTPSKPPARRPAPKPVQVPAPLTSRKIKHIASEAMQRPSKLTAAQIRSLGASAMAHIEPRANNTTALVCKPTPKKPSRTRAMP